MSRVRYMGETESNKVEWAAQCKRDAFWAPILEGAANVFAFFMFVLYVAMWAFLVAAVAGLLYLLIGGPLNMFGVFVPGISVR